MESIRFVLASRPIGFATGENFREESFAIDGPNDNEVLLKSWYISVDPYMRGRMSSAKSYSAPFEVGQPIIGNTVAKVIESRHKDFKAGDVLAGFLPWATYTVTNPEKLRKIDISKYHPGYYLGILGPPGYTAYFGMNEICKPVKGETAVISGAAGAVGLAAGQIAGIHGLRVIGIAGSDEKCNILKEFGFNETINYKTSKSIRKDLGRICPEGVDVYFDNVGGEISEAVIANIDFHARIALCGQISQYNSTRLPQGNMVMSAILTRSVLLQGFIVRNYSARFDEAFSKLNEWLDEGKLKYAQTIIKGFERLPDTFFGLFNGINVGKLMVEVE